MKKEIVGIFVCMLLIAAAVLPVAGTINNTLNSQIDIHIGNISENLKLSSNRMGYSSEEKMAITLENIGNEPVQFKTFPKIEIHDENGNKVYPPELEQGEWILKPGEREIYVWDQKDPEGRPVAVGVYTVETTIPAVELKPSIFDIGYVILVAGDKDHAHHDSRTYTGTKEIYYDLEDMGYSDSRIQYLNREYYGTDPDIDDIASESTVENAITVWADSRVNFFNPLYIIMFDHGGGNSFSVHNSGSGDHVYADDLRDWIDTLQTSTNAKVHVWIMACYSGSFIDEVSRYNNIITTSTSATTGTAGGPSPYYEYFTKYFWPKMVCGYTWLEAFNYACYQSHNAVSSNTPLLDDNGDGVGHGVYDTSGGWDGYLPHSGDGSYADTVYMGALRLRCKGMIMIPKLAVAHNFYPDPPVEEFIPLWVVVNEPLIDVKACLLDPYYSPQGCWDEISTKCYNMKDDDGDGKWTCDIPVKDLQEYDAKDFTFLINAEDEEKQMSIPIWTGIGFAPEGQAPPDKEMPFVTVESPREGSIIGERLSIKGTASDNRELRSIDVYLDQKKIKSLKPEDAGHAHFEVSVDTMDLLEGIHTILVMVVDNSDNRYQHMVRITIVGAPKKPQTPTGETQGNTRKEYSYKTTTIDPQGDQLYYKWDWGDGTDSDWLGPFESGDSCEGSHSWTEKGDYDIRVITKDKFGKESEWSDPLKVSMPKSKGKNTNHVFIRFLQIHPNLFPFLRIILGL
jgi:hypothetical protein